MEGAASAIVFGVVMIILGLSRGLWRELVDGVTSGIANFTDALRGAPVFDRSIPASKREREPLIALLGLALVLLGVLAFRLA